VKFCLYTICISPHQLPLAQAMVKLLGEDEYRYVYVHNLDEERVKLGWMTERPRWMVSVEEGRHLLEECDVLMSGERDLDLFKRRSALGKRTIYCSERWFKPIGCWLGYVDGRVRMLVPRYRQMAKGIVELVKKDKNFMLYPMGIHAARDFAWLLGCRITDFERKPGGKLSGTGKYLDKLCLWGYFVAPSTAAKTTERQVGATTSIMWAGRFLDWKRVGDLIKASGLARVKLDLYGAGPEESSLKRMAKGMANVSFHGAVSISMVRELMREHDVYVLTSNSYEGWGAVVNEALEEGMRVIGTREAGSSATILPEGCLYSSGRVDELVARLKGRAPRLGIGDWSPDSAALSLLKNVGVSKDN
jgi:hypothetical protein